MTRPFLICIHDATPAYARETDIMLRELGPLVGRRLSLGVVPAWDGRWPLDRHPDYCRTVDEASEELLLHGCFHRRRHGGGVISFLAERSDEMNGLDRDETHRTIERGQQIMTDVFGRPALGFLAPAWQRGQVRPGSGTPMLHHVLGFFSLDGVAGRRVPLATWSWDCGRWGWLGYVGQGVGSLVHSSRRVPSIALHPSDLARGFWPTILRLTRNLLDRGFVPTTPAALLQASDAEVAA